jgi:hypothetical protein
MKTLFATKVWSGDYTKFLSGAFERKYKPLNFDFNVKWLLKNNGLPEGVKFSCADRYIDVEKNSQEALRWFGLNRNSFKVGNNDGYYYSIAEITLLYLAGGFDYLVYIQGDTIIKKGDGFVKKAIKVLEEDEFISVVSPKSDVNTWENKLGLDTFFSDQAFVIRVPEFRKRIFNYPGVIKEFPEYAGDSFEHKICKYLRANHKYRLILKDYYAFHPQW